MISRDTVNRGIRTFIITFVTLFGAGGIGFLKDVSAWGAANGQRPFPDAHNLSYLAVTAFVAALLAAGTIIWGAVEDALGKGLLRTPPAKTTATPADQAGHVRLGLALIAALIMGALLFTVAPMSQAHPAGRDTNWPCKGC